MILEKISSFPGAKLLILLAAFAILPCTSALSAEANGVTVTLEKYDGPALVHLESIERFEAKITVDRKTEHGPLTLLVKLPNTGRNLWPFNDVQVLDSKGKAVTVKRGGISWHTLWITVPDDQNEFTVHADKPEIEGPENHPEKARNISDETTGLKASISQWPDRRKTALSLRFDDSHPSHLSKAIPILREYGFKGTFMINPGGKSEPPKNSRWRSAFKEHLNEWQAVAKRGDQEFANHTAQHRGAKNDAEMESEIGDASEAIWELFPEKSKLLALNLGGGTYWETSRTLRNYLDKYHLFDASSGSLGMDDVYGNRVEAFREHLERHIDRGIWCRTHFHYIGENLSSSESHFRAALDIAKKYEAEIWIAGMADIYKYQAERRGATLTLQKSDANAVNINLSCSTKPELFDQDLTIEIALPKSWPADRAIVTDTNGKQIVTKKRQQEGTDLLFFEIPPVDSVFTITRLKGI